MNHMTKSPQNIAALLDGIVTCPIEYAVSVTGICADSRETQHGDLFIAHAGPKADRPHFIEQAIKNGAVAILRETEENTPEFEIKTTPDRLIPIFSIPNLNAQVGSIAARFYQNPSQDLKFIGVTGTNGKTSCTQFIAQILDKNHIRCGVIGTLGAGFPGDIVPSTLTTPPAISLQKTLATLREPGATHIAMEVSSHSLIQGRVAEIPFNIAVFTNLTRDHLDYHGDMAHYAQAKRLLFLTPTLKHAVINADDAFGRQLIMEFAPHLNCYAYSIENTTTTIPTVHAENLQCHSNGFSADISSPWGRGKLHSKLLGRFNLSNLLATLTTLCLLERPLQEVLTQLSALQTVPGRMQCFGGDGKYPLVVVDYSHSPDSLEKALIALREHSQEKLWCVFGCGGDRDVGKRPLMARIAESHSDHVIVTNDNPRFEDPKSITDDILQGFSNQGNVMIEHDRKRAIAYAVSHAKAGDIVLIAGKGHETYQQIGDTKIPFSDAEEVELQLKIRCAAHKGSPTLLRDKN